MSSSPSIPVKTRESNELVWFLNAYRRHVGRDLSAMDVTDPNRLREALDSALAVNEPALHEATQALVVALVNARRVERRI